LPSFLESSVGPEVRTFTAFGRDRHFRIETLSPPTFGWPYETTAAMTRLAIGGILEKYTNLKMVTHHCAGMVPYFAERVR
jgi:predicted TIM-barrel fold metal-dependent hydrolase